MPQVAKVLTPLSASEAEREIVLAWRERFGAPIRPDVLRLLLALWDLETASGLSQANNNYGNLIATKESQFYYADTDSGNARRFRSYDSASEGAAAFVAQLTSETRKHWRDGLLTGDPNNFVVALKTPPAYFEADFNAYLQTFLNRWSKYDDLKTERAAKKIGAVPVLVGVVLIPMLAGLAHAMRGR